MKSWRNGRELPFQGQAKVPKGDVVIVPAHSRLQTLNRGPRYLRSQVDLVVLPSGHEGLDLLVDRRELLVGAADTQDVQVLGRAARGADGAAAVGQIGEVSATDLLQEASEELENLRGERGGTE